VIREGKVTNRLDKKNIRVLQRETELEYLIYNGTKSITMLLEDVRIGDCMEVCYTTNGYNPIFQNTYSNSHSMQWSIPVKHVYRRLKKEKPSILSVRCFNYDADCKARYFENNADVVWEKRDVKSLAEDENTPGWFDPYPRIELTEYGSWGDVVEWGCTLYDRRIDTDIPDLLATLTLNLDTTE
jgi:hypothetical protein